MTVIELVSCVRYGAQYRPLRDNVQWMDFLSSNKILHSDVALTLLEFSFFQNSVSALEETDRIYEQFLLLAQSDLTQFNGGSRTILVEVCKVGVHIAQFLERGYLLCPVKSEVTYERIRGAHSFAHSLSLICVSVSVRPFLRGIQNL
ncbi:hypothetical protein Tsp_15150 [Trichinella spiralis]|uniref:hypothetical protein n=1 Tax=Trichinella spiralis TaxID=6334 RepID=UPI0001EFE29A|nr:hypothetical protein Tsp_15150 [Trichinella spiralis]